MRSIAYQKVEFQKHCPWFPPEKNFRVLYSTVRVPAIPTHPREVPEFPLIETPFSSDEKGFVCGESPLTPRLHPDPLCTTVIIMKE